ncbi:MAG TPA: hypothetical protein VFJ98_03080 [Mycobacteriales bacterium]|nr:hypothetical protein [Mycobacteriales bacterium]
MLGVGIGWDPDAVADALRTTSRRARREVAAAMLVRPEPAWRALVDARARQAPDPPPDLRQRAAGCRSRRQARRLRAAIAAGSAAACLLGLLVAVARVATAPPAPPATATSPQLLPWPARGSLVADRSLVATATRLWRASSRPPSGRVFVLFAGRAGAGRLVVLEGFALGLPEQEPGTPRAAVAVVGEHRGSFGRRALALDQVAALQTPASVLAVPYDGDPPRRSLVTGSRERVLRLLAAPGVRQVATRTPDAQIGGGSSFVTRRLTDGLSEPFVDSGQVVPRPAVRIDGPRGQMLGLLPPGGVQPVAVRASVVSPPRRWQGLPHAVSPRALADDLVWAAQLCDGEASVEPVWAGGAPGFVRIRLERLRCGGRLLGAQFLTGSGESWQVLAGQDARGDVYAADLFPEPAGVPSVLVVGSRRVAGVAAGGAQFPGRVAVLPLREAGHVRATDAAGRPVRWL